MANEQSYAAALSTGGRVARLLSAKIHENLYDPAGLRFLMEMVPFAGAQSATTQTTKVARGLVAAAATTEVSSGFTNSLIATTNFDIVVARYGALVQPTDLFKMTSDGTGFDLEYLVGILMECLELNLTDLLTSLFANIAGNVGTSGSDMTVDDFFDAIYYLNLQNNGAMLSSVLHAQQINDLIESVRGETGPLQFRQDAQGLLAPTGVGFKGQLIGVPIYQSDSVPLANANADRRGCMFAPGAFAYQVAPVAAMTDGQMINPADVIFKSTEFWIERSRDALNGMSSLYVNFYPGVAEQEDLRGCRITTDA